MSLNDEMTYEINHQVSYDPRRYECNLCNCVSRSSNQLSYEATDVGSWSFVGPSEPVGNECEAIYEIFHVLNCGCEIK